ncbi:hypothetical protein Rt10032_c22g6599 [Rhodotorula toruloides]|uniref:Actin-like ATPase domain-containing protein n=1 Tax=Rhodotorula toruloides TaxID=5286 RepID=A0A511KQD0_RHOTO|nr:hypothetical protein Rt10032_c22g6599 [Rhodotorula toruloides]
MKKIFSTKRSKTPAIVGGGSPVLPDTGVPVGTVPYFSAAAPPSLLGTASPASGLMKPRAVYGSPSPQLTQSAMSGSHTYPTPPTTVSPPAAGSDRLPDPSLFTPAVVSPGLATANVGPTIVTAMAGQAGAVGVAQEAVTDADVGSSLGELERKLSVGIDFGTTFSGVAYGSSRHMGGTVRQILNWPGSYETFRKVPTCIAYYQASPHDEAVAVAWGIEAKAMTLREGFYKVEWFKLFLDPQVLREGRLATSVRLPELPRRKQPIDVITDFLSCLWKYAKERITEEIGSVADLEAADVILTVPAAWDAAGCQIMRQAALSAGLVQSARGGDTKWRERLRIITEPEAAAIHASTLSTLFKLKPSQTFIICDAGGGTVDCATYKLIGQLAQLEIAEMSTRSGANCGSLFLDLRFEQLVKSLLHTHPVHLDAPSLLAFRHSFSECDKLVFAGEADDDTLFRFNCFNVEDSHDPTVGLEYGELVVPGSVLRRDVFDPVVDQVLSLLTHQLSKLATQRCDALILVGGFASSPYLCQRIQRALGDKVPIIARPRDTDVATLQGAARYGLSLSKDSGTVSSVISPRSYIMKCKLPASDEDRYQRPGFIVRNDAGVEVCENRLSYLVAKGAVVRKGQQLRSRYCKFSRAPTDCMFTAVLYVSDEDKVYRYTDEGPLEELCRWTVDLSPLPSFQYNASTTPSGGFYTEFTLGLLIDSAEIIGVLVTDEGEEVGRATFEFFGQD